MAGVRPHPVGPLYPAMDVCGLIKFNNSMILVENEDSPVLSRSFFRTAWTKPKFDPSKPYVDRVEKADEICKNTRVEQGDEPQEKTLDAVKEVERETQASKNYFSKAISTAEIKNISMQLPGRGLENLNLEQLLAPPMAAVCYVVSRAKSDSTHGAKPLHWRPHSADPAMKERMKKVAEYIELSCHVQKQVLIEGKHLPDGVLGVSEADTPKA